MADFQALSNCTWCHKPRVTRHRNCENESQLEAGTVRLKHLIDDRVTGKLGEEDVKLSQVMLLCALPYSSTPEKQVVRTAQLGDKSQLRVTFTAASDGVRLPYGSDRRLLAWLIDRSIRIGSPFVALDSAWAYQREMGLAHSGRNNELLQQSFRRICGLAVNVERKATTNRTGKNFFVIDGYNLPRSIDRPEDISRDIAKTLDLSPLGIQISSRLYADMKEFHAVLPRAIWRMPISNSKVHDILLWLFVRCYAAASETVIPWTAFEGQFGRDSNPRRQRVYIKDAILQLKRLWLGVNIEARNNGVLVGITRHPMLADDPDKKRVRTLFLPN